MIYHAFQCNANLCDQVGVQKLTFEVFGVIEACFLIQGPLKPVTGLANRLPLFLGYCCDIFLRFIYTSYEEILKLQKMFSVFFCIT